MQAADCTAVTIESNAAFLSSPEAAALLDAATCIVRYTAAAAGLFQLNVLYEDEVVGSTPGSITVASAAEAFLPRSAFVIPEPPQNVVAGASVSRPAECSI